MFNVIKQNKTSTSKGYSSAECKVVTPQHFTMKKTALFGIFSLLSILLLNVPILLENTYAYGTEDHDDLKPLDEKSWVRNHFITGSPVHPNLVPDDDLSDFSLLEERANVRNHFSYELTGTANIDGQHTIDNFHNKRP